MKILVFYQYFGTPSGSWSTRIYELSRRWVKAGHQVTVVTAPYEKSDIRGKGFISRQEVEGIRLIVINSGDSNRDRFLVRSVKALLFAFTSCILALTVSCDMVIASSGPITVGIPALIAKWFRRKKMIFEIRDLWPQGALELGKIKNGLLKKLALWFEKLCYRNASLVVACSPGMAQSVNKRFPEVPVIVISNASDNGVFETKQPKAHLLPQKFQNKKLVIYAGSLGLMDHGHLMIRAMLKINDPEIQLVIIGEGAERKSMEQEVADSKTGNIHFLGLLPKLEVASWLDNADVSLVLFKNFPVLQTSSPNKLFDAFAAGIPVIHNTTGWIRELCEEHQFGISIQPDDEAALADAILKITRDSELKNKLASNSKNMASKFFNRDHLASRYLEALQKL